MGLFNMAQMEQINAVAKKSKTLAEPQKSVLSSKSVNSELNEISEKVTEYFKDSPAILITTKQQLHDYITEMIKAGYGGIDTETTGLDRQKDTIVGVSLYYPGGVECYIPSKHLVPIFDTPYRDQIAYEEIGEELQRLVDAGTKLIFANADYDLSMIWKDLKVDLIPVCYYDVIIAWRCIKENERHNGLKALYNKYVLKGAGDPMKFSDFFSPAIFPYCKPQVAKLYAANDAKITYDLFKWQLPFIMKNHEKCKKRKLESIADLIWGVEFPLIGICQMMHRRGIYLEQSVADMLKRKYIPESEKEHKKLREMVQELMDDPKYSTTVKCPFRSSSEFNPNSTPHVKWLCYDLLKLDGGKKGGTGKEILGTFNLPITKQILKCRSLVTLIGTFVEKLPNSTSDDSRIHCQFKQIGADCVTGDTIIPTKDGYRLIKDICEPAEDLVGEHVDIDPVDIVNCDQEYESAISVIAYKNYPTIKITTDYGITLEGTHNHPVMVNGLTREDITRNHSDKMLRTFWDNRHFKTISELKIGDILEIPCNFDTGGSYQRTHLVAIENNYHNSNAATVPEYYDEDFAEFLGMYHADGSSSFHDGTYRIQISNCNPDVIKRCKYLSEKLFNVTPVVWTDKKRKNESTSYINSKSLGCLDSILCHGALNKKIPEAIWRSPRSVINAYIRGMTLDSSVHYGSKNSNRIIFELNVTNEEDTRFIQLHLISQGIIGSIVRHSNHDGFITPRLKFSGDGYNRFRTLIGFIESDKCHDAPPNRVHKYDRIRIGDSFRVCVKQIEHKESDVYDLHVPRTHSFISNGIISHNTGRMSSSEPNMQNIPSRAKDIRHMFRATPGYVLLSSDYSLRKLAVVKPC